MYDEPGSVNALGSHLRIFLQKDNEENEDLLAIQPKKSSSLSLVPSTGLFPLIDARKDGAFGSGPSWHRHLPGTPQPGRRRLPMGHWLEDQCHITQHSHSRGVSGLAH